jgi:4-carboxymuconolactone decarboxylase
MTSGRIPLVERREALPADQRAAWDQIVESRGHVAGPFAALLHTPEIARRVAHVGAYVRFESSALTGPQRELAILATARAMDCRYEWAAHAPLARKAGVRDEAIAAIRDRRAPAGLTPDEAAIVTYVTQLLRDPPRGRHDLRRRARAPGRAEPRRADRERRLLREARLRPQRLRRGARPGR